MSENSDARTHEASPEHRALVEALDDMAWVIASLDSGERDAVVDAAARVATEVQRHCDAAGGQDGLLAEVERRAGRTHHVSQAHAAHEQLLQELHAFGAEATQGGDARLLRERGERIVRELREHLELEGDLVYDAVQEETGVGD